MPSFPNRWNLWATSYKAQVMGLFALLLVALVFSHDALQSMSLGAFLLLALLERRCGADGRRRWAWRRGLRAGWQAFWRAPQFWLWLWPFGIVLLTGAYSSDLGAWAERLRLRLPFLLLPFAVFMWPRWRKRDYHSLYAMLLAVMALGCADLGWRYWQDAEAIHEAIGQGRAMPTRISHIRFSLLLALSVLGALVLLGEGWARGRAQRAALLGLGLFNALGLHVLSVRSGLLALYVGLALLLGRYIWRSRRWALGLALALGLAALPFLAYHTLPSFQQKVHYTLWDRQMDAQGQGVGYSDSYRLMAYGIAWEGIRAHPWLGVGFGDIPAAMRAGYARRYPDLPASEYRLFPHNQFLSYWLGSGTLGLLLFTLAFFVPFFYQKNAQRDALFLCSYVLFGLSFLPEDTLENAVGTAMVLMFTLPGLKYLHDEVAALSPLAPD